MRFEMIKIIEIERFSVTSSKPFDQVVAALNAAIGHPDMVEFERSTHQVRSFADLRGAAFALGPRVESSHPYAVTHRNFGYGNIMGRSGA
jgi:hypothetical protein